MFSPAVVSALRRLGIDPADPTDLYATGALRPGGSVGEHTPATTRYTIFYHCAGVVRDGPPLYRQDAVLQTDRLRQSFRLASGPAGVDVSVAPQRLVYHDPFKPPLEPPVPGLIEVCFGADVPWLLDEEHPFVTRKREYPKPQAVWAGGRLRPVPERRRPGRRARRAGNSI